MNCGSDGRTTGARLVFDGVGGRFKEKRLSSPNAMKRGHHWSGAKEKLACIVTGGVMVLSPRSGFGGASSWSWKFASQTGLSEALTSHCASQSASRFTDRKARVKVIPVPRIRLVETRKQLVS